MHRSSYIVGTVVSFSHFKPIHNGTDHTHGGEIDILKPSAYGLYGLSNSFNLSWNIPYKYWKQFDVEHEDSHHRNEVESGWGDLTMGLRGIVINENFGPGQRLFIDGAVTLPTGKDYQLNPFGTEADSIDHIHFALGTGQVSYSLGAEWWLRSEFPFIIGLSSNFKQSITESKVGFRPGSVGSLTLHAIQQSPVIKSVFPYLEMEFRREWPDEWEGKTAPNSGAIFIDASGQMIVEVNEQHSIVLTLGYPLWQNVKGSQLSNVNFAISYRFKSF